MKRMFWMDFSILLLWAISGGVWAQDALERSLQTCMACHGVAGASYDPKIPIIWGQNAAYLKKQMSDYRDGNRDSQIMTSMAEQFPRNELTGVAAFMAAKPWPRQPPPTQNVTAPALVVACQSCHGSDSKGGETSDGYAPRLAGQFAPYLEEQMSAYASGARTNHTGMAALMKGLPLAERVAIARYLATLR